MQLYCFVAGVGLYAYFAYAHHQIIENYLWAVADAAPLPPNGQWFMGVVNTGTEPLFVKQVFLANGQVITVNSPTLKHNQW